PERRGIVDAVAGHRDDVARLLVGADQGNLLGRAHPGENADLPEIVVRPIDEPLELPSFRDIGRMFANPDGSGDTPGGRSVVPCDHDHTDTGTPAVTDGIANV